jgi:hypothetical protein
MSSLNAAGENGETKPAEENQGDADGTSMPGVDFEKEQPQGSSLSSLSPHWMILSISYISVVLTSLWILCCFIRTCWAKELPDLHDIFHGDS